MDYFDRHKEYTHIAIAPDDLLVKREHYEALVKTLEKEDYPVLGGVCNVDMIHEDHMALTIKSKPHVIRGIRREGGINGYTWVLSREIEDKEIIEVNFAGMPFLFIRRDIVEQIPLTGDTPYDPNPLERAKIPRSFDCAFCWNCREKGIPIRVDCRVKMVHLNGAGLQDNTGWEVHHPLVGKEPPFVYFQQGDEKKTLTKKYAKLIYDQNEYNSRTFLKQFGLP